MVDFMQETRIAPKLNFNPNPNHAEPEPGDVVVHGADVTQGVEFKNLPTQSQEPTIPARLQQAMRSQTNVGPNSMVSNPINIPVDSRARNMFDDSGMFDMQIDKYADLEQQVLTRVDIDIQRDASYYLQKIVGMTQSVLPMPARWSPAFTQFVGMALSDVLADPAYILDTLRNRVWQVFPRAGLSRATFLLYFFALTDAIRHASIRMADGTNQEEAGTGCVEVPVLDAAVKEAPAPVTKAAPKAQKKSKGRGTAVPAEEIKTEIVSRDE